MPRSHRNLEMQERAQVFDPTANRHHFSIRRNFGELGARISG